MPGRGDAGRVIFRDAALARLNSPEQLDQRIAVMPPAMRLLAGGTGIILLACLAWAFFGEVPTRATGRGVLGDLTLLGSVRHKATFAHDGAIFEYRR